MIRMGPMSLPQLDQMLDWAAEEGWNPGLDDATPFFAADPGGFFVALDGDTPVAAISVVNHSDAFAFLGLYLCRPSHRGQGVGYALWQLAVAHAGDRVIGLDGVADQQANYAKSGFVAAGETTRYTGALPAAGDLPQGATLRPARAADLPAMIAAEAAASGQAKPRYLSGWFTDTPNRRSLVLEQAGRLTGLLTARRCREGTKIGPLLAPDAAQARALLAAVSDDFDGPFTLDVPAEGHALHDLCQEARMTAGFKTARMYRGPAPHPTGDTGCFAVTTLELG